MRSGFIFFTRSQVMHTGFNNSVSGNKFVAFFAPGITISDSGST
jgi:hypothetical protein